MDILKGEYSALLNSEDIDDVELPLIKARAKGGTMILWKKCFDPFIYPVKSISPSFLPIIFCYPGVIPSIHVSLYLPTAGKDVEFAEEVVKLDNCLNEIRNAHPEAPIFIRGDANANEKDTKRQIIFRKFCNDWDLFKTKIGKPTYHHFVGEGRWDSELDVLLSSKQLLEKESLSKLHCKHEEAFITSHHDALSSVFTLPTSSPPPPEDNPLAPRISNDRVKIHWSDLGIQAYSNVISTNLARIRSNWLLTSSPSSISVLLQSTNAILSRFAKETNKFTECKVAHTKKSKKKPKYLLESEKRLCRYYKMKRKAENSHCELSLLNSLKQKHASSKRHHTRLVRLFNIQEGAKRDKKIYEILSSDPLPAYQTIKSTKQHSESLKVSKMTVGDMTYRDEFVPDGLFESIRQLKTKDNCIGDTATSSSPDYCAEYENILEICRAGAEIPQISKKRAFEILKGIRKNVNDFFSVTALHYLNAGEAGLVHFHFLLNAIITDINLAGLPELNTIHAHILYKGHGKDRTSERAYRSISTCPLLAKALDIFVRDMSIDDWNSQQADTQFQGSGSSHDLAALLLTETIQHSLNSTHLPLFAIFLDAKSAFDRVMKELLVRNLHQAGTDGHALLYLDQRLKNRITYCEYDKELMGPIKDELGLEQGGVSSSDVHKLYNNEQLDMAQKSGLGVSIRNICVSSIGLADALH